MLRNVEFARDSRTERFQELKFFHNKNKNNNNFEKQKNKFK